jgi:Flp pilus assembly protein TadD
MSYSQNAADPEFQAGADRPPTANTLYSLAKILTAQGKDRQCQFVLLRTIREYPYFTPAYCELAELHVRLNEPDKAVQTFQAALEFSPHDPVILNNLGICWLLKGRYAKGLTRFTEAASVVSHDARYRANMAVALGMMGREEESLSLFEQILPIEDAYHNLRVICEARSNGNQLTWSGEGYDLPERPGDLPISLEKLGAAAEQ